VAIAAAGSFQPEDVIATLVVEAADNGDVTFSNVTVGDNEQKVRKFNVFGAVTGTAATVNLSQNAPNPFSPNVGTTIGYSVPADGKAVIRLFDLLGREVKTLVDADLKAGSYQAQWDGRDAAGNVVESGMYYYRIEAAGQSLTKAMQVRK
jgi:flagellar hook assembly protein FlgD